MKSDAGLLRTPGSFIPALAVTPSAACATGVLGLLRCDLGTTSTTMERLAGSYEDMVDTGSNVSCAKVV